MWRIKSLLNYMKKWLMDESIVLIIWSERCWVTAQTTMVVFKALEWWRSKQWHNLKKEAQVRFNSTLGNQSTRRSVSCFLPWYMWLWRTCPLPQEVANVLDFEATGLDPFVVLQVIKLLRYRIPLLGVVSPSKRSIWLYGRSLSHQRSWHASTLMDVALKPLFNRLKLGGGLIF